MNESTLLTFAVFVFVMMAIGLALTVWEFRYGQPRREDEEAPRRERSARAQRSTAVTEATAN